MRFGLRFKRGRSRWGGTFLVISTKTRLQYTQGYIELGMLDHASDELEAIEGDSFLPL